MTVRLHGLRRRVRVVVARAALAVVALSPLTLSAQQAGAGRIVGRIIDAQTGAGLADAGVQIVGTLLGTQSGVDGRFTVKDVPAGTVTIQVRRLGFQPKQVTGILLDAGQTLEQNISLAAATITLQATMVTASAERGTVNEALDQQRSATGIVNAVTAEQIAKSPDGDAAQAVQRVSGVTVQDGRYVFVRGLGERYTTTTLNGTRMPSPEPEKRVVPLDLFPAGLLQTITTSKTFTPDLQGDFSGAQVDIKTREFPARRSFSYSATGGYNPNATGSTLLGAPGVGGEWYAAAGSKRDIPTLLKSVGNFQGINLNQGDKNRLIGELRDVWTPTRRTGAPNTSTSLSFGGNDPLLFGQRIGYLLSGTYSYAQEVRTNEVRALAQRGSTPGSTNEIDRFTGESGNASVLWGGLFNLSTMLGTHSRVMLNNTFDRSADNQARSERGSFENEGILARIDRMQYVERRVYSSQLAAEHQFGARHRIDWAGTVSGVQRDEPDRSEFVYVIERDTPTGPERLSWLNTGNEGAVRTFSTLHEDNKEGRANYQLTFPLAGRDHSIKVGGLYRTTDRDADTRAFSISAPNPPAGMRDLSPEQIFDGRFTTATSTVFELAPLAQGGQYSARDRLSAGYAMAELGLTSRVRLIGGARYERDELTVDATSTLGDPERTTKHWNDVLPAAALNVKLTEVQSLRVSLTRTLARPEYRELTPIKSRDVLNGDNLEGNAELARTRISNADLRWEWYPAPGEVLSIGVFGKRFTDPIERVYRASGSGTPTVFYLNAESANNYGVELEIRKGLEFLSPALAPFVGFANVTVMQSEISLGSSTGASATNPSRRMVGQAPYVVNSGLTYTSRGGNTSATLLYNRVGERIDAAGDLPLPDVVRESRDVIDFSLRFPLLGALSGRFDARNLLDSPYTTVQGTVTRESYRVGRVFQTGLVWKP